MTVVFKKKDAVEPVQEEMSERHKQTLIDAGLMEAPSEKVVPSPKVVKPAATWESMGKEEVPASPKNAVACLEGMIDVGKRVVITNGIFDPWLERYKSGDVGTVLRMWPATQEAVGKFRSGIAEIQLDKTREKDHGVCLLHCWELGLAP